VSFISKILPLAGRESPCRDNTIEGNVGVWGEAYAPLMDRDNGEAAAEGQPPPEAFPKGFMEAFIKAFAGLTGRCESGPGIGFSAAI
jgi:hypothetical protein